MENPENVFYYEESLGETDSKSFSNMKTHEKIKYIINEEKSNEIKIKEILNIIKPLKTEIKNMTQKYNEMKKKFEKSLSISRTRKSHEKNELQSKINLDRSFNKSPGRKQFRSNISIKKSNNNSRNFISININDLKQNVSTSITKSRKNSLIMKSTKTIVADQNLTKYKKFISSIEKIRERFSKNEKNKNPSNLKNLWKWLKALFEEYIDLKVNVVKFQKKNFQLAIFKEKIKKILKCKTEDEIIDLVKKLQNYSKKMLKKAESSQTLISQKKN
jgi:hypothetical protein